MAKTVKPAEGATLIMSEYSTLEAPLSREVYTLLRARYAAQIEVLPAERRGYYRLTARDYAGRIGLPGGPVLVIRPKVGAANLFYMLTSAAGLARFFPPPTGLTPNPEIFSFILAMLVDRAEALLRQGLYSAHLPAQDDLQMIRGRILMAPQVSRHAGLQHRHVCAYSDLTPDTAENRVLYATLRLIPSLLGEADRALAHRVRVLLPWFSRVAPISRAEALALLRGISLHRLNAAYAPVLGLCRLALQHLTLDERPGPHPLSSFLVDMPRLFESFVTEELRKHLRPAGLRVVAQRYDYLDETRRVGIRPDVLVYGSGEASPLLVLDAKYKRPDEASDVNRDLYQVSAYMDRYGLRRGVLVYPQFGEPAHSELRLKGSAKRLHFLTIDLSAAGPRLLDAHARALAAQVADLARDQ